jgi:hypothetical protein
MRDPISWVKRILGNGRHDVLALITPEAVRERHPLVRFFVAGGTLAALTIATLIGVVAMAALLFAVAAIYFLATQVLGLKVNIDPQAFYQQFQQQAAQAYGAN